MGDYINENFDLAALLMIETLDVRKFAEDDPAIPVSEYYDKLSEVLARASEVIKSLDQFINLDGDRDARRNLNIMINLLDTLRCSKFVVDLHAILRSYEQEGNWRLAATQARAVKGGINDFFRLIYDARVKPSANGDSGKTVYSEHITLIAAIRLLDNEETNRKATILAVDDSAIVLKSLWQILSDEFKVLTLPKPTELEELLHKQKPDLFLLDYLMPELNGFDLIPIIRNFPEHKDTPIIFLTSDGTIDNVTAAMALGACDFMVKPFNAETLRAKIRSHIAKK